MGRDQVVFIGTVLENTEDSLLVKPQDGSSELNSADKISVSLKGAAIVDAQNKKLSADQIKEGERVEITYDGQIAESYPAQIHNCKKVKLID